MAASTYKNNIFKLIAELKSNLSSLTMQERVRNDAGEVIQTVRRNSLDTTYDLAVSFVSELEAFLKSGVWTENKLDLDIVDLFFRGYKSKQVVDELCISADTFRTRVSRMTKKINSILFGGSFCPDELYSLSNDLVLKHYLFILRNIADVMDIHSELPIKYVSLIEDRLPKDMEDPVRNSFSDADLMEAVRLIQSVSRRAFNNALNNINPKALKYVLMQLDEHKFNESFYYFQVLSENNHTKISDNEAAKYKADFLQICSEEKI